MALIKIKIPPRQAVGSIDAQLSSIRTFLFELSHTMNFSLNNLDQNNFSAASGMKEVVTSINNLNKIVSDQSELIKRMEAKIKELESV